MTHYWPEDPEQLEAVLRIMNLAFWYFNGEREE